MAYSVWDSWASRAQPTLNDLGCNPLAVLVYEKRARGAVDELFSDRAIETANSMDRRIALYTSYLCVTLTRRAINNGYCSSWSVRDGDAAPSTSTVKFRVNVPSALRAEDADVGALRPDLVADGKLVNTAETAALFTPWDCREECTCCSMWGASDASYAVNDICYVVEDACPSH